MTIPTLRALARRDGRPCDVLSAGPWAAPLISRVPEAGQRLLLNSRKAPYLVDRSQSAFVGWLRQRAPGPVCVCENNALFDWLLRQGGVGPEWVRALGDLPGPPGQHITTQPLRLAAQTPAALAGAYPLGAGATLPPDARPQITEADQRDRDAWLARHGLADAPLMLFQPGNEKTMRRGLRRRASNTKGWPEQRRAQVLARVQQRLPVARLLLCGSPGERPLAEDIHRLCGGLRVSIATDELPITRLLALQARAHSMVSIDTGPAHSAAAMGCPLVVLFAQRRARVLSVPLAGSAPVVTLGPAAEGDDDGTLSISADAVLGAWRQRMSLRLPGV